jgi:hypothetical protein
LFSFEFLQPPEERIVLGVGNDRVVEDMVAVVVVMDLPAELLDLAREVRRGLPRKVLAFRGALWLSPASSRWTPPSCCADKGYRVPASANNGEA